ncbi:MAG: helix-turn-helix domain-containing protein [Cyanobium sp. M30B3]|nr:MAG: helix-turn-helix domain-containing protein [Cyanobium sp. M30B3]
MGPHPQRLQAIRRCLDGGEPAAQVAAELGVAPSTLRGWMRWARLERQLTQLQRERDEQAMRQRRIEQELALAAEQLELLRQRLDQAEHTGEG